MALPLASRPPKPDAPHQDLPHLGSTYLESTTSTDITASPPASKPPGPTPLFPVDGETGSVIYSHRLVVISVMQHIGSKFSS